MRHLGRKVAGELSQGRAHRYHNAGHEKRIGDEVHSHPEHDGCNLTCREGIRGSSDTAAHSQSQTRRDQNLPNIEGRLEKRTPAYDLSQDGRQGKGPQSDQRWHEEGEDHKETLVRIEGRGFASPVHHDRPYPAPQGKSAHRSRDDPLALVDVPGGRLPPCGDDQDKRTTHDRSRDDGPGSTRYLHSLTTAWGHMSAPC